MLKRLSQKSLIAFLITLSSQEIPSSMITPLTWGEDLQLEYKGYSSTKILSCYLRTAIQAFLALIILEIALILHFLSS